jgi:hypothetical protein
MTTKIICPTLIIIFCILLFFAIVNNQRIKKLNDNVERFDSNFIEFISPEDAYKIGSDLKYSTALTQSIINGKWTWYTSKVDSNYYVSNLCSIDVSDTKIPIGTITVPYLGVFNINYIVDENITAKHSKNEQLSIHVHILRVSQDGSDITKPWFAQTTYNAIISIFLKDSLLIKFSSYKMLKETVDPIVYAIIISGDIFREYPPPMYDLKTYDVLISNKYSYPSNIISISDFSLNPQSDSNLDKLYTILNTNYNGKIKFAIQRVFLSPSGNEIFTRISDDIPPLICIQNKMLPTNIQVAPFQSDKDANKLVGFFIPKATILYFYKLTNSSTSYDFIDTTLRTVSTQTSLGLQNDYNINALDNFFTDPSASIFKDNNQNISYNNIDEVKQINNSTYTMVFCSRMLSNLKDSTLFDFRKTVLNKL